MTNQQIINAAFTAIATLVNIKPENGVEFEVVAEAKDFFNNPMFDSIKQDGYDKNLFAIHQKSGIPFVTKKGWDMLFGQPVQPKPITISKKVPIENFSNKELLSSLEEGMYALCHRSGQENRVNKLLLENRDNLYSAIECLTQKLIFLEPVITEPVVEVKAKAKKVKVAKAVEM